MGERTSRQYSPVSSTRNRNLNPYARRRLVRQSTLHDLTPLTRRSGFAAGRPGPPGGLDV